MYLLCIIAAISSCVTFNPKDYPKAPKMEQVDNYHGQKVEDPYRNLENEESPLRKKWIDAEIAFTDSYFKAIPFKNAIHQRLRNLWNYTRYFPPIQAGNFLIYFKNEGLLNQNVLMIQEGSNGQPKILLDPNTLSPDGTIAITDVYLSHDGKYLAYTLAKSGSDWNEIHVLETATGRKLTDHLQWIKFTNVSWDASGFFYCRFPVPKEEISQNLQQQVYYHKLGTDQKEDILIFEDKEHPYSLYKTQTTEDNRYLILYLYEKETGPHLNAVYLKDLETTDKGFVPIIEHFHYENEVIDIVNDNMILLTNAKTQKRKVVLIDLKKPSQRNWKTLIAESQDVLSELHLIGDRLFGIYIHDGYHIVKNFSLKGDFIGVIDIPPYGSVTGFEGKRNATSFYYSYSSFTAPPSIFEYEIKTGVSNLFKTTNLPISTDDYITEQSFFKSKDGTSIPVFLVHKKELKKDGQRPTLLYGYGGFGVSVLPQFNISNYILLEQGGVYAQAILRGGGEYGEKWHKAGMLKNKENVFEDFIGVASGLIDSKYTSSEKLAIKGASNGGLLVAAAMTKRPDLFGVVFSNVGVLDMLRFHKFTIGWNWVSEYGSSDNAKQFKYLYKYSPLHNIHSGVNYPATLISTADHDDRVVPLHSYKFAATLQEKNASPHPILLRIDTKAGHGLGKPASKRIEQESDQWAFLFCNIGLSPEYK